MRALQPHFRRSLRTYAKLQQAQLTESASIAALVQSGVGVVFATSRALLRYATPTAESQLGCSGLTVTHGQLRALRPEITQKLHAAIEAAARPSGGVAQDVRLPSADGEGSSTVVVASARYGATSIAEEPLAMLVLGQQAKRSVDGDRLKSAFGLTPAEARLLAALVQGERLADYAARCGISVTTAKTHLSGMFAKTGERRQADLIRRALADPVLQVQLAA